MKLSRTIWLLIAAGVFIIASAYLFMVYSGRADEQEQVNEKLTLAQSNLRGIQLEPLSSRQAELESQLSEATSQFEAVKAILSQPVGSAAAATIFFDVAKAYGLEVTEMTSSDPVTESLEGVACSVITLTAKVEGDIPSLVGFVTKLNSYLPTSIVKSITITVPETNNGGKASADIQLAVYTYQGD